MRKLILCGMVTAVLLCGCGEKYDPIEGELEEITRAEVEIATEIVTIEHWDENIWEAAGIVTTEDSGEETSLGEE